MISVFSSRTLDAFSGTHFICSDVRQTTLDEMHLVGHQRFKSLRNHQVATFYWMCLKLHGAVRTAQKKSYSWAH